MSKYERTSVRIAAALLATSMLVLPACSSGDEDGTETSSVDSGSNGSDTGGSGDGSTGDGGETTAAVRCEDMLTLTEVESIFGGPAVLEEPDAISNNAEIGQITCTWTTPEDETNTGDLDSQLIVLQYYGGGKMSGKNFYDPEVQYPDSEPLDLGDDAFVDTEGGIDIGFVEGDTAGFLNWTVITMGGAEQDQMAKKDAMIDLAQSFHDRVA